MEKAWISVFVFLVATNAWPMDLEGISENRLIRFNQAVRTAEQEGATYRMSLEAAPAGIIYESICGLVFPKSISENASILNLKVSKNLPAKLDWREMKAVSTPKNQGETMYCWAFSLTGGLESQVMMKGNPELNLSEQDLINCNQNGYNSQTGGFLDAAQCLQDKGLPLEKDCPYIGTDGNCTDDLSRPYKITGWKMLATDQSNPADTDLIKQAIMDYGPICCGMTIDGNFMYYSGGVYNHDATGDPNHAVILVGWDESMGQVGCWILKNSSGTQWGEGGFMYIEYGKSRVGVVPTVMNMN
ncbi:MAG: C1 family peptidase [Candidatus Wallbacteria bacterium]|nr:C1 family peptidase [Candidatus Wallbacteria bacterium]